MCCIGAATLSRYTPHPHDRGWAAAPCLPGIQSKDELVATQPPGELLPLQREAMVRQFAFDVGRFGDLEWVSAQPIPPVVEQRHSTFLRILACMGAGCTKMSQVLPQRVRREYRIKRRSDQPTPKCAAAIEALDCMPCP